MPAKIRDLGTATGVLLDYAKDELRVDGTLDTICFASVIPGSGVYADYGTEECGGMLWVRLATAFPSAQFPQPHTRNDNCAMPLAYPLEIGVLRPAPATESFGKDLDLPNEADSFEASQQAFKDMHALHRAILKFSRRVDETLLGSYTPIGPEGDVLGGNWALTIALQ